MRTSSGRCRLALHLNRFIDETPTNAKLYIRRCKAYALQGQWSKAVADLLRGAALLPPAADATSGTPPRAG